MKATQVALALGSNLGAREANLDLAIQCLGDGVLSGIVRSTIYETIPMACQPDAPAFANMAIVGESTLSLTALHTATQDIQCKLGRPAVHAYHANRVIDIDILLYGGHVVDEEHLTVPHPRMLNRDFVMTPLAEIAADWPVPPTGENVARHHAALQRSDCPRFILGALTNATRND